MRKEHTMTNITDDDPTAKIRALNDRLRTTGQGGQIVITPGVQVLGKAKIAEIIAKIQTFNEFDENNDPYKEHDFGKVVVDGKAILFKIDYYDRSYRFASPDPNDEAITNRVMTIMLQEDY